MPTNYPGGLDTAAQLPTNVADNTPQVTVHAGFHDTLAGAMVAAETKLGTGATTPAPGQYLRGTGTGSAWQNASFSNKTGAYSIVAGDDILSADATSAPFPMTLPSAVTVGAGWDVTVIRINGGANAVTIATVGGQTISGQSTYVLSNQWAAVTLISTGANWLAV